MNLKLKAFLSNTALLLLFALLLSAAQNAPKHYASSYIYTENSALLAACENQSPDSCSKAFSKASKEPAFSSQLETLRNLGWASTALQWLLIPIFGYLFFRLNNTVLPHANRRNS